MQILPPPESLKPLFGICQENTLSVDLSIIGSGFLEFLKLYRNPSCNVWWLHVVSILKHYLYWPSINNILGWVARKKCLISLDLRVYREESSVCRGTIFTVSHVKLHQSRRNIMHRKPVLFSWCCQAQITKWQHEMIKVISLLLHA